MASVGNDDIQEAPCAFQAHARSPITSVKSRKRWAQGWVILTTLRQAWKSCWDQTLGGHNAGDGVGDTGLLLTSLMSKAATVQEILFTFIPGRRVD